MRRWSPGPTEEKADKNFLTWITRGNPKKTIMKALEMFEVKYHIDYVDLFLEDHLR